MFERKRRKYSSYSYLNPPLPSWSLKNESYLIFRLKLTEKSIYASHGDHRKQDIISLWRLWWSLTVAYSSNQSCLCNINVKQKCVHVTCYYTKLKKCQTSFQTKSSHVSCDRVIESVECYGTWVPIRLFVCFLSYSKPFEYNCCTSWHVTRNVFLVACYFTKVMGY